MTRCIWRSVSAFSPSLFFTPWLAIGSEEAAMLLDYALGGAVTFGLLVYLVYALTRPEKF